VIPVQVSHELNTTNSPCSFRRSKWLFMCKCNRCVSTEALDGKVGLCNGVGGGGGKDGGWFHRDLLLIERRQVGGDDTGLGGRGREAGRVRLHSQTDLFPAFGAIAVADEAGRGASQESGGGNGHVGGSEGSAVIGEEGGVGGGRGLGWGLRDLNEELQKFTMGKMSESSDGVDEVGRMVDVALLRHEVERVCVFLSLSLSLYSLYIERTA
jgi:hypothetical protein